ncbi:uncharacterized protein LOC132727347 [Ruditapes philippinarum]|uniref:uncharacterized protein LOC132727347 n=1 Tax=Ruditapes philippinarum TaxID=129788 RepID=UPI00295B7D2C|nr:uncharacterized protein LOC132727347 [Ruditapes philippinarum]
MFHSPEYRNTLSLHLSEVLEDIGVNEDMVMKRRRQNMLVENIITVGQRSMGLNLSVYYLGSQSEGTTTLGLKSDADILHVNYGCNVIQDLSEWKQNQFNLLMIHDKEYVTPGYCFLQLLRPDKPEFETVLYNECIGKEHFIKDSSGRILLKNTFYCGLYEDSERHGPSNAVPGGKGYSDIDIVYAMNCNSLPQSTSYFLNRQSIGRWPTSEMIRYISSNGCCLVGASSKISTYPELEWRKSTSLGERYLMFNLNITQIHCYVLMKIILKTSLTSQSALSSYMCKTVLLHCIQKTDQNIWKKNNLFTCLTYCLLELQSYIQNENCPHFIIPENNLMAGNFTAEEKLVIERGISDIIQSDGDFLFKINLDHIWFRLNEKGEENCFPNPYGCPKEVIKLKKKAEHILDKSKFKSYTIIVQSPLEINEFISYKLNYDIAVRISDMILCFYGGLSHQRNHILDELKRYILKLVHYSLQGNRLEKLASRCLVPFLFSSLGSIMASSNIQQNIAVQYQALKWLSLGLKSDVTSGGLKLASVLYCAGDMDKAELTLKQIDNRYNCDVVESICACSAYPLSNRSAELVRNFCKQNEYCINRATSFCVRFMQMEISCVPRELQYEMMRSTQGDMQHRKQRESAWMNFAVVDSLPFLFFLQYKAYGHLQTHQDQQRALKSLARTTVSDKNLGHRETALNLLGQCMEEDNKCKGALQCFMISRQLRERNNAANFHICNLLLKYVSRMQL